MVKRNFGVFGMLGGLGIFIFLIVSGIIGAFCFPYALNTWLGYFNKPETVLWWQGMLLGFVPIIGQLSIFAASLTWIIMLFLMKG